MGLKPITALCCLAVYVFFPTAHAATLPPGFTETRLAQNLNPTAMDVAPDGRVFLCDKSGKLLIVKNGALLAQPFVTVGADDYNERGLIGVALDPAFATNQFVYVFYTAKTPATHNRVSRFTANGDVVTGTEHVLFDLDNLNAGNHNGGAIHFGQDGKLYVASGNNVVNSNSQSMQSTLGKILRLNSDGTIPTDNPFYGTATGNNRAIWALGLRNPFSTAVQPGTGRIIINDVGEGTWEEINDGIAGSNYGWPATEGATTNPAYRTPLYSYNHSTGCAITGGAFYPASNQAFPAQYRGQYFFSDYCGNFIKIMDPATRAVSNFATNILRPLDLRVGPDGTLYYISRGNPVNGGAGSLADNTSTNAGSLYQVKATPVSIAANAGTLYAPLSSGRWRLPAGASGMEWFDLSGEKKGNLHFQRSQADTWISLPESGHGVFRVRVIP